MLFNSRETEYIDNGGPVRHLDGSSLLRPTTMPRTSMTLVALLVAIAAVIGGFAVFSVVDNVLHAPERTRAAIEQNLARGVSLDLPQMTAYIQADDATILQSLADTGFTTYEIAPPDASAGGFDVLKLPSDVTLEQAALMYAQGGISRLSATDASLLLNGSWRMTMDRTNGTDMRVRYADFASGTINAAVSNAIASQGLGESTMGDTGIDEAGNTFQSGTVGVGDQTYAWRVSAIDLSSVYSISGLPESAVYVGIRMSGPLG